MPSLFVSKYEKKYRLESAREKMIREIQTSKKCSREYAVRYYDYIKQYTTHAGMKLTSGLLFTYGAHKICNMLSTDAPIFKKSFARLPLLAFGLFTGCTLYDKLTYYYLNPYNMECALNWEKDLASLYGVKYDEMAQQEIPLTPYERMKSQCMDNVGSLNLEGDKSFRRISKDKNDFYYMFGKVRNLENIVYLKQEEIEKAKTSIELQMKIDSVRPSLMTTGDINKHIEEIHESSENLKYSIENSRNFRSIKDKFLGLPFMLKRHQQFPTPTRGTWQFNVYEQIFGEAYDIGQGSADIEEKINKFNYHLFLHPSVIEKYDTNSEEFDMYIRQLNVESSTAKELQSKQREYFCKNILPFLNLSESREVGYDTANYLVNKQKGINYANYLQEQYSGQKEEKLFREAEETKYMNKNEPFVQRVGYSTILKSRIGIRAKEMEELLANPSSIKKMRRALEYKYAFYEPTKHIDQLRQEVNEKNYLNTIIDREIDTTAADFKMEDLHAAQYDRGEAGDNPEEEAIMSHHVHSKGMPGMDFNSHPYGITGRNEFYYFSDLDWNDYAPDVKSYQNLISPKKRRFEMFTNLHRGLHEHLFFRSFNSQEFADKIGYVVPYVDYKNEELKSRVLFRSNYHRFVDNIEVRDSDKEKLEFLEYKTMEDTYAISDDVTEDELDQALFESTYNKPYWESDEFRGLAKRNHRETEQLFKVLNFEPYEMWYDSNPGKQMSQGRPFTDKAQMLDPLCTLYSEVEQPSKLRSYVKRWRSGAEMRFRLPYYPETKDPSKTFKYV